MVPMVFYYKTVGRVVVKVQSGITWNDLEDAMASTMTDPGVIYAAFEASDAVQAYPDRDIEAMQRYTMLVLNHAFANLLDVLGGQGTFDRLVDKQIDVELGAMLGGDGA